ncbi:permease [Anaerocolumna xylanovorans]|uniref:Predicted permease n=1 Tax=Anaerocolumna xylanovorans DSM 12503 TaxID=1121345 RepID=A0A1M7YLT0_9FIRM|nr:permease [Anaerocolumna xylanovorans]SHO53549.1 Predicted permease [Anaerocolumna xylanovorans DSM 12503]
MKKMVYMIKEYSIILLALILYLIIYFLDYDKFKFIISPHDSSFLEMFIVLPPIMILIGLINVWVSKDLMIKLMGENSGMKGSIVAFLLGTVGVGPLYMAFPVAIMFLEKGATFFNIFIFMGAWASIKVTQLLFEMQSLGVKYTLIRLLLNFINIVLTAAIINTSVSENEKRSLSKT